MTTIGNNFQSIRLLYFRLNNFVREQNAYLSVLNLLEVTHESTQEKLSNTIAYLGSHERV
ncbi:hypothetical protein ABIE26_003809 [Pedobacter africanus]|uniref:Uncharacterized protein n=1 Tax=Pedobacter africanus TaxID=151894 RepID=A0ACC6L0W3_9SPHI|nr:hypothetical protein [Pedobacter africanus]